MPGNIQIFGCEKEDGLEEVIRANASFAYLSPLSPVEPGTGLARAFAGEEPAKDVTLFHMQDILVSTGENKNADYFGRREVFDARSTPEDKPLNFEHDDTKIIGHITATQLVDEDLVPIDDDVPFDDLPDKFHILNGSVIYTVWTDKDQVELIQTTIEEIKAGEWCVSMECVLRGFDYILTNPEGERRVVVRNEETSYLTKHMRQYGGSGVYADESTGEEYKISRYMRGVTFSGKGLVRKPANPKSVIVSAAENTNNLPGLGYVFTGTQTSPAMENFQMPETNPEVKLLQDRVAALETENKQLKQYEGQAAQAKISGLETAAQAKATEIGQLQSQYDAAKDAVADVTKRAEAAEAALKASLTEVADLKASAKKKDRVAAFVGKGADQVKAESLADKFSDLNDAQFAEIVDVIAASFPKKKEDKDKAMDDKDCKADDDETAEKKDKKDKSKAGVTAVIDNAVPDKEPALASEVESPETARASVAAFLQKNFLRYNASK